jgi:hypothetical protein
VGAPDDRLLSGGCGRDAARESQFQVVLASVPPSEIGPPAPVPGKLCYLHHGTSTRALLAHHRVIGDVDQHVPILVFKFDSDVLLG